MDIHKVAAWAQVLALPFGAYCAYGTYVNLHPTADVPMIVNSTALAISFGGFAACLLIIFASIIPWGRSKKTRPLLRIHSAKYGIGNTYDVDVADFLRNAIGPGLSVWVGNSLIPAKPDPAPGISKKLVLEYEYKNMRRVVERPEYSELVLPVDTWLEKRLQEQTQLADRHFQSFNAEVQAHQHTKARERDANSYRMQAEATLEGERRDHLGINELLHKEIDKQIQRANDAESKLKMITAPRVVPVRYTTMQWQIGGTTMTGSGIVLSNDGDEPTHDVQIEPFTLCGPSGWRVKFMEVSRIAKDREEISKAEISGRNISLDLKWAVDQWLREEAGRNEVTGELIPPLPITFTLIYRDHSGKWYKSVCELTRDVRYFGEEIRLKFIRREPYNMQQSTVPASSATGVL